MKKSRTDERVSRDVAQSGWHVIGVIGDEKSPPFGYSVGLFETFKHPEILILGVEPKTAMGLVNDLGRAIECGSVFAHGAKTTDLIEGYACVFVKVPAKKYPAYVARATAFYGDAAFPLLQCVWPDRDGHLPWDSGYEKALASEQPVLGRVPKK